MSRKRYYDLPVLILSFIWYGLWIIGLCKVEPRSSFILFFYAFFFHVVYVLGFFEDERFKGKKIFRTMIGFLLIFVVWLVGKVVVAFPIDSFSTEGFFDLFFCLLVGWTGVGLIHSFYYYLYVRKSKER